MRETVTHCDQCRRIIGGLRIVVVRNGIGKNLCSSACAQKTLTGWPAEKDPRQAELDQLTLEMEAARSVS